MAAGALARLAAAFSITFSITVRCAVLDYGTLAALANAYDDSDEDGTEAYILPVSKPLGQVTGIGIDSKKRLIAFHRANRTWNEKSFDDANRFNATLGPIKSSTILVIDPKTGKVLEEHGDGVFFMPHGLTVDHDDNIWVTDVALHQVFKLDKNFKTQLTLGERLKPGDDAKHFCKPTDVAVAKNGHFFVADGYCNSRVMKFDQNGKLLATFGSPNSEVVPEDGEFWIPHSLALIEDMNLICVADRENERIQCFSAGLAEGGRAIPPGIFITKAENIGRVYAIREKRHYLVGVTGSDGDGIEPQLFVMDMNTGKANTFIKGIENAHALEVSDDGMVYIAQIGPNQIVQLSLQDQP
ncbi:putative peptidyl-alpha-hydroxyglycine alpha-amidating lyase F21F3.1 [Toxocara canis]|uniref:peptidylamidoglycolate lyase n=1 Tax=Toxocara canis TaxID=6265 RepID=A0A0B2VEN7_TOXCA|nr:putative peptidyl-alpha-hydroxyglycine alpha-amidating lyase F21F3.1 [Toxocara canis]